MTDDNTTPPSKRPSLMAVIASVLAAAIGIQSNKNREKDFTTTSIWPFVIGGIVFTVMFIAGLTWVAELATH